MTPAERAELREILDSPVWSLKLEELAAKALEALAQTERERDQWKAACTSQDAALTEQVNEARRLYRALRGEHSELITEWQRLRAELEDLSGGLRNLADRAHEARLSPTNFGGEREDVG